MRSQRWAVALALPAVLLAGCGDQEGPDGTPVADEERITPEAIAAVALEHVGADPDFTYTHDDSDASAEGEPEEASVSFRFDAESVGNGDLLTVGVGERTDEDPDCEDPDGDWDGCELTEIEGGSLFVVWQNEEPEEDPGIFLVAMIRDEEIVSTYYAGTSIEADPREEELSVPYDAMEAIVTDQRISLETTSDVVDLGDDIDLDQAP